MMIRYYKVTYVNEKLNKQVEITLIADNRMNAIYNANCSINHPYRCPDLYEMEFIKGAKVIGEPVYVKEYSKELSKVLTKDNSTSCSKCGGSGYIPKFVQYNNGVCYCCGGLGKVLKSGIATYTITDLEEVK